MNYLKQCLAAALLTIGGSCLLFTACNNAGSKYPHPAGTLDGPLEASTAPSQVQEAWTHAERFHSYEIMSDTLHSISVEAIAEIDTTSTEGYGIVVQKGTAHTTFPNLSNARCPMAMFDGNGNMLWLTTSAVWGTGVQVDWLYLIRFDDDGKAYIAKAIDPYDIQQQLCQRLRYSIDGEQLTLYDGSKEIARATNTVTDMGGFDSETPLWIGEQIRYDLSGDVPCLLVTPGVSFTTGLVLTYDDMPTLSCPLAIGEDGKVNIGRISEYEE